MTILMIGLKAPQETEQLSSKCRSRRSDVSRERPIQVSHVSQIMEITFTLEYEELKTNGGTYDAT